MMWHCTTASSAVNGGGAKIIYNIGELSGEQIEALLKYIQNNYININDSLRGLRPLAPEKQATLEVMKSTLSNSALSQDMILYRGTSIEALGSLKNLSANELVRKQFVEKGFMSTSKHQSILNQGGAAPKITAPLTPGKSYELPAPWIEWLEEYGGNARVIIP